MVVVVTDDGDGGENASVGAHVISSRYSTAITFVVP